MRRTKSAGMTQPTIRTRGADHGVGMTGVLWTGARRKRQHTSHEGKNRTTAESLVCQAGYLDAGRLVRLRLVAGRYRAG